MLKNTLIGSILFASVSYVYALDIQYGLDAESSNCGNVTTFLDAIPFIQGSNSPEEAFSRLTQVADPEAFKRYCTEGECLYENDINVYGIHGYIESLLIDSWQYGTVKESYGENWAKGTFKLQISNICGESSGEFMAEFTYYCNGAEGKFTELHTVRDQTVFTAFRQSSMACLLENYSQSWLENFPLPWPWL